MSNNYWKLILDKITSMGNVLHQQFFVYATDEIHVHMLYKWRDN